MGFLSRFFKRGGKEESAHGAVTDDLGLGWTERKNGGDKGVAYDCIDRIASKVASIRGHVYDYGNRKIENGHWMETLFRCPSTGEGHFNFFYQSVVDYFNGGIIWVPNYIPGSKAPSSLSRIPCDKSTFIAGDDGHFNIIYEGRSYRDIDIIYIPCRFGYSKRFGGKSIFRSMSDRFDTSESIEDFTRCSFSNGLSGKHTVIDVSGAYPDLTKEQAVAIKRQFVMEHCGVANSGSPILKKKGFEYSEIGESKSAEAQMTVLDKVRSFQRHDTASMFGVPLRILDASSGGELEDDFILFLDFAVRPVATQIQEAFNGLLSKVDASKYFEFDYNSGMKVSLQRRVDAYTREIATGLLSPNEARKMENLGPIEAGDTFFVPANYMPLKDETIAAYMAKQKSELAGTQHFAGGDDKQ